MIISRPPRRAAAALAVVGGLAALSACSSAVAEDTAHTSVHGVMEDADGVVLATVVDDLGEFPAPLPSGSGAEVRDVTYLALEVDDSLRSRSVPDDLVLAASFTTPEAGGEDRTSGPPSAPEHAAGDELALAYLVVPETDLPAEAPDGTVVVPVAGDYGIFPRLDNGTYASPGSGIITLDGGTPQQIERPDGGYRWTRSEIADTAEDVAAFKARENDLSTVGPPGQSTP